MIYRETLEDGFTQGELCQLNECKFKWNMRYNERRQLEGWYKIPLMVGHVWHKFMENIYSSKGKNDIVPPLIPPEDAIITDSDREKILQSQAMLEGMAKAYRKYYADEIRTVEIDKIELELSYEHPWAGFKIPFQVKLDLLLLSKCLFDHKTTSMLRNDILAKWDFKFQFMFYCWVLVQVYGLNKIKSFTVNAVKKPQIRQNHREPLIAYARRVEMVMLAQPGDYFYRNTIPINEKVLRHFEKEILEPMFIEIELMRKMPKSRIWEKKNTEACHAFGETCQFFPVCAEGAPIENYIRLEKKHTHYDKI